MLRGAAHAHRGWANAGKAAEKRGTEQPIFSAAETQQSGVEAAKKWEVSLVFYERLGTHDIMGSQ